MIDILSAAEMGACDRRAIEEFGIPGVVLMENAGIQTVECILEHLGAVPATALVVCGKGNNGGDGLVVARHLANAGSRVEVLLLASPEGPVGEAAVNLRIVQAMGLPLRCLPEPADWEAAAIDPAGFDVVVDAILGTGIRSAARGVAATAIASILGSDARVVAVDLPSGLDADAGRAPGPSLRAQLTVTFAAPKPCHVLPPAAESCGELVVVDISIPDRVLAAATPVLRQTSPFDWPMVRPQRAGTAHKGDAGRVAVIGGARGTAGAAVLAARAAVRAGAGLVHVLCPHGVWLLAGAQLVEPLVHPVGGGERLGVEDLEEIRDLLKGIDMVALGPGLGRGDDTDELVRRLVAELAIPMVIDADGLNALAGALEVLGDAPGPRILTPHPGEAARLLGTEVAEIQEDRPAALARLVARTGATVILKGAGTLIGAPGRVPVVNPTGNPGLASGGTGDVLTGVVAALAAQGLEPFVAAWGGAWTHGRAGDLAALGMGSVGFTASDVVERLPAAIGEGDGDESEPDA